MSNLVVRTISGTVFVTIVVASILVHPIAFGCVFSILTGLAVWEFYTIVGAEKHNRLLGTIGGVMLFVFAFLFFNNSCLNCNVPMYLLLGVYPLYIIGLFIAELFLKKANPISNWAYLVLGQVMVALPFALLNMVGSFAIGSPIVVLALFVIIWTNDTGAYCVGSLIGKHKMFVRVSPGKSWEGLVGGVVFALVVGWIFSMYVQLGYNLTPTANLLRWLGFALLVSTFGTLGDLTESLMKRTLGIKDSGNIIPGHGGMLDRFDSMLMAAPVIAIYILLLS